MLSHNQTHNMNRIKILKRKSNKLREFKRKEWIHIHQKLYGEKYNKKYWDKKQLYLKATEGKEILGVLIGELKAGVLHIPELIIKENDRGKGIGKKLMSKAEKWAKAHHAHEINLVTGSKWKAKDFYLKLGYKITAKLPKHYSKTDFVLFRKFID